MLPYYINFTCGNHRLTAENIYISHYQPNKYNCTGIEEEIEFSASYIYLEKCKKTRLIPGFSEQIFKGLQKACKEYIKKEY